MPFSSRLPVSTAWFAVPIGGAAAGTILVAAPVSNDAATMLAITVFCIALWITTPIPPPVTGLLCIGLVGAMFTPELALTGLGSPTVWLVVFGLLLGEATRQSGLADWAKRVVERVAFPSDQKAVPARTAYRRLLFILSAVSVGVAFLIPSALVRVLLLAPILVTLSDTFDSEQARIGVFLGPVLATFYAAPGILTAGLPNIITTGIAESLGASGISWSAWTLQMFPLMGVGRAAVVTAVVYILYRPQSAQSISMTTDTVGLDRNERRMFGFLLMGVLVWCTDAVHSLHPVFGALVVVLLSLLPGIGVVSLDALTDVDISIVFFLGAVIAIGTGLSETGFTETAANTLLAVVPQGAPLWMVLGFVFTITVLLTFLMEGLAVASVLTPILVAYANRVGLPLEPILMTESVALGTYFFPYQTSVFVAILGTEVVDARTLIRTAVPASLLTTAVLLPVQIGLFVLLY